MGKPQGPAKKGQKVSDDSSDAQVSASETQELDKVAARAAAVE
jgi:hypothetical protein